MALSSGENTLGRVSLPLQGIVLHRGCLVSLMMNDCIMYENKNAITVDDTRRQCYRDRSEPDGLQLQFQPRV